MRYLGSKNKLMPFIEAVIEEVTKYKRNYSYIFADLFAGTGIVGKTYREKGCYVISNDMQYYSYVLNKHFIENNKGINESLVLHLNAIKGIKGFIYKHYCESSGKACFSDYNAMKCDAIRLEIEKLYQSKQINYAEYVHCLASLIDSIDRYANTTAIYSSYLKTLKPSAQHKCILKPLPIIKGISGRVYHEDANILIRKISGDILYLDPPYNSRQYCRIYHLLETIAKYDKPQLIGDNRVRYYFDKKSKYCSPKTAIITLDDLIANANFKYIFMSYNDEGIMSSADIRSVMSKYGKYSYFSTKYRRFKLNKEVDAPKFTTEYIHCLIK